MPIWYCLQQMDLEDSEVLAIRRATATVQDPQRCKIQGPGPVSVQHLADLAGNKQLVLPVPAFNVINGGSHAGNKLAMQVRWLLSPPLRSSSCPNLVDCTPKRRIEGLVTLTSISSQSRFSRALNVSRKLRHEERVLFSAWAQLCHEAILRDRTGV